MIEFNFCETPPAPTGIEQGWLGFSAQQSWIEKAPPCVYWSTNQREIVVTHNDCHAKGKLKVQKTAVERK
jgi:hypothetical protein